MKKIKLMLIKTGSIIATLLMFSPLITLVKSDYLLSKYSLVEFVILLIITLCYDLYMYSQICKTHEMEEEKKRYYNFIKNSDKKLNLKLSYKEKNKYNEEYIEKLMEKYF